MSGADVDTELDRQNESAKSTEKSDDPVTSEIADSREEWTRREQEKATEARSRSGISEEFGKPVLELPEGPPTATDTPAATSAGGRLSTPIGDNYKGEGINKDISPTTHYVSAGEKLDTIAKEQLGKDATKADIDKYVKEIEHVNGLKKGEAPAEGVNLKLPGHTADGGFVTMDDKLVKHTTWPDGRVKAEDTITGKWILTKPGRGGSMQEEHGGSKRPEENFVLVKEKNGRYHLAEHLDEQPWEKPRPMIGLMNVDDRPVGSKQLMELAEKKIKDPEQLAQFRADMLRYEEQVKGKDLGSLEASAVYMEISRMLEKEGDQPTTAEDRAILAQQVMRQIATPSCIDQGHHNTCNVASVESRTYKRNPQAAAKLVADVATTGKYTATDGTEVQLSPSSLKRDSEAGVNPPPDGARSYASQIFQITATNIAWRKESQGTFVDKNIVYEQYKPGDTDGAGNRVGSWPQDTGERLIDYSKKPPQEVQAQDGDGVARAPNLRVDQIVDISNAITGEPAHEDVLLNHEKNLIGDGKGATVIDRETQLENKLADIASKGQLPCLVTVDTTCEPFWTDSGGGAAGGSGGTHCVTITGYEAGPPARVSIDGQWGAANDHAGKRSITVHDLYMSMRNPKASPEVAAELRKEVEARRDIYSVDPLKEFELTRLETNAKVKDKEPPPANYDSEISKVMIDAEKKWKSQDEVDPVEQERVRRAFIGMLKRLPANRQDAIIEKMRNEAPDPELEKQYIQLQARRGSVIIR